MLVLPVKYTGTKERGVGIKYYPTVTSIINRTGLGRAASPYIVRYHHPRMKHYRRPSKNYKEHEGERMWMEREHTTRPVIEIQIFNS